MSSDSLYHDIHWFQNYYDISVTVKPNTHTDNPATAAQSMLLRLLTSGDGRKQGYLINPKGLPETESTVWTTFT
jgi:hypothetical protein